jgi:hypothetical protein
LAGRKKKVSDFNLEAAFCDIQHFCCHFNQFRAFGFANKGLIRRQIKIIQQIGKQYIPFSLF